MCSFGFGVVRVSKHQLEPMVEYNKLLDLEVCRLARARRIDGLLGNGRLIIPL